MTEEFLYLIMLSGIFYFKEDQGEIAEKIQRTVDANQNIFISINDALFITQDYDEIEKLKLGFDQVYSGFALGGSTAAQKFSVPALRLVLRDGAAVLLDRGSARKLKELGKLASGLLSRPLEVELPGAIMN
jgi:hypothetical protein